MCLIHKDYVIIIRVLRVCMHIENDINFYSFGVGRIPYTKGLMLTSN